MRGGKVQNLADFLVPADQLGIASGRFLAAALLERCRGNVRFRAPVQTRRQLTDLAGEN